MTRFAALLLLVATGCGSGASPHPAAKQTVNVFAAASLTKAFGAVGKAFEASHRGVRLTFSFAGSQSLVAQVQQGAPASVLATADTKTIITVQNELANEPVVFAHNQLAVITASGNPRGVTSLADLAKPGVTVVLADPSVPVGAASAKALKAARVIVKPVSLEDAVTGVVTKVRLGEADAGIAYVTDLAGSDVDGTPVAGTRTDLAIATLKGAPAAAADFVTFVQSAQGQQILMTFGFT